MWVQKASPAAISRQLAVIKNYYKAKKQFVEILLQKDFDA